ncbi:SDR family NAD(P)-dependent oxidoreductase [Limibacillus sp. MBR-115]|jgi:NAD(P)-dependent dehydrogenase (short-subunit alcohol dehydrogenase family)|uniref:SDR family NAD(P)-dependent oxidoreductase n=1 Tax=Limibacillus sp. MBR-115 TaxID=3156465 RepID=UPI003397DDEC
MLDLKNKVALVTGCGSILPGWGNGKAIATILARQGATVFGIDYSIEAALETKKIIESEGGKCLAHQTDVTSSSQVKDAVDTCIRELGKIDILVNNVGQSEPGDPVSMDENTWDAQFDLNVKSAFMMCKHTLPHMVDACGGAIINVASVAALRYIGKPQVAYSASKAALLQFSRASAVIYAPQGIRLNCVIPGLMFTPLVKRLANKYAEDDYDGFVAQRNKQVPAGRMGDAWDVAHAVAFLASDEAKYINGTEIIVDGGLVAATR